MSAHEEEGEFRKKLISGAKWTAVLRMASQMLSWLTTLVVVRFLTPEDYGLNAMLSMPIDMLLLFTTLGAEVALIQRKQISKEEIASVFGVLLLLNGVFFLIVFLGAAPIAAYFHDPRLVLLIQVASVVFLLSPFRSIPNALLDRALEFKLRAQVDMVAMVISALLSLALAIAGAGVWALIVAFVANFALRSLILARLQPWLVRPTFHFARVKHLFHYGGIMTLSSAVMVLTEKIVNVIAGPRLGATGLGYYSVASEFARLPMSKVMPIVQQTMFPAYSKLQDKTAVAGEYLLKTLEISALIMFPLLIGTACVSLDFVVTVFGEKWIPVALPLAWMAAVTPLRVITQVCYPALNALGHANQVLIVNLTLLLLLSLGMWLTLDYGLTGTVLSWVAVVPIGTILTLRDVQKRIGVSPFQVFRATAPASVSSLVMATPLVIANLFLPTDPGFIRLLIESLVAAGVYLLAMYVLFRHQFEEIRNHLSRKRAAPRTDTPAG